MSKIIQNLVLFMEPQHEASDTTLKAGKMYFNRFFIDENSGLELLEIHYLKESSKSISAQVSSEFKLKSEIKGNV